MVESATISLPISDLGLPGIFFREFLESIPNGKHQAKTHLLRTFDRLKDISTNTERSIVAHLNERIVAIDKELSASLSTILQQKELRQLQSHWMGIFVLTEAMKGDQLCELSLLCCTKDELCEDFAEYPDFTYSALYHHVYKSEYDQAGGIPYTAMLYHFDFSNTPKEMMLLNELANVASSCHTPVIANASLSLFNIPSLEDLETIEPAELFAETVYNRWNSFRDQENARYIGLVLPRFLVKNPDREQFRNAVTDQLPPRYCRSQILAGSEWTWLPASYGFGILLIKSFRRDGWCVHIRGPRAGGLLEFHSPELGSRDYSYRDSILEVNVSDQQEQKLAAFGLMTFKHVNAVGYPCLYNVPSLQRRAANDNSPIASLPYLFLIARFAHCQKIIQREGIGRAAEASGLELELTKWLDQYISANPTSEQVRLARPLKEGSIKVTADPASPGIFEVHLTVVPHIQAEGINTRLSLISKMSR